MYVDTEEQMGSWLLKQGLEVTAVQSLARKPHLTLEPKAVKAVLDNIVVLENLCRHLARKKMTLIDYLGFEKAGKIPIYRVEEEMGKYRLLFNEKEWREYEARYIEERRQKLQAELSASGEENVEAGHVEEELGAEVQELWEFAKLSEISKKLEAFGLSLKDYHVEGDQKGKPLFRIKTEEKETEVFSLEELLLSIRSEGRKGAVIQRYKGLGAMNPEQLWETTMDPVRRKLLQVTIEDGVGADQIFTTLMGDKVEPRRLFIEQHALDVKNLDI